MSFVPHFSGKSRKGLRMDVWALCKRAIQRIALCMLLLLAYPVFADDVVVIVNKDNPNQIDRAYVAKIYTGALRGWPDGSPVVPYDVGEEDDLRELFYKGVVGKSMANMRAIRSQNIFTGKGLPPKIISNGAEVVKMVAGNRNAIGYVFASELDASVKVLEW